ncbi:MAG TPA: Re/Si-specific NAD(P)(+) transhydrogenase subunit alpha [Gemmatimonadaceae bacterium]|nr:Re/Si-specific NAD(P)(+) transhydrogenase subunit alpha [Gemmatimonadaceae bacterium]
MRIAIPREIAPGERRVALTPDMAARLIKGGHSVAVQSGAGEGAGFPDSDYQSAGATLVPAPAALYAGADAVLKVHRPTSGASNGAHEATLLNKGCVLISFFRPASDRALLEQLADREVTAFSMELVPRISRAQSMDALSSQATVAGYKAVLMAANTLPKFFPMLMTAAGTIRPATVLVIGAGVAGLQAIATARRLGAVVEAFDTRPAVKEQVQSLGAKFVSIELETHDAEDAGGYAKALSDDHLQREQALIAKHVAGADVVITTAQVPGRPAPRLITAAMAGAMRPGSVIVDLAAESGGNCEASLPGRSVAVNGVTVLAPLNVPSELAFHASQMYARNVTALLELLAPKGTLNVDMNDEIIRGACITHGGRVLHPPAPVMAGT